jgi:hypothetical protein
MDALHALLNSPDGLDSLRPYLDENAKRLWRQLCSGAREAVDVRAVKLEWRSGRPASHLGRLPDDMRLPHRLCSPVRLRLPLGLLGADKTPQLRVLSVENADLRGDVHAAAALRGLGPRLVTLRLRYAELGGRASAVAAELRALTSLTELNLSGTVFRKGKAAIALASSLGSLTGLRALRLAGAVVGAALPAALQAMHGLRELDLHDVNCLDWRGGGGAQDSGPALAAALAAALASLTGLVRLDLGSVWFPDCDWAAVLAALSGLVKLDLPALDSVACVQALSATTGMRVLAFDGLDGLDDGGTEALAAVLGKMPGLLSLSCAYRGDMMNALPDVASLRALRLDGVLHRECGALAAALSKQRGLRVLVLTAEDDPDDDPLEVATADTSASLDAIAAALTASDAPLVELEVGNRLVGPLGAGALARMLAGPAAGPPARLHDSMRALVLSYTRMGREGAAALAPALARLTQLRVLDLQGNELGAAGVAELQPAFARLARLEALLLDDNGIDDDGVAALAAGIAGMTSLRLLQLFENPGIVRKASMSRLLSAIQGNMPEMAGPGDPQEHGRPRKGGADGAIRQQLHCRPPPAKALRPCHGRCLVLPVEKGCSCCRVHLPNLIFPATM